MSKPRDLLGDFTLDSSPEAWERLMDAIEPAALLLVIDRRLGERIRKIASAEDILQESLLAAWRDRERVEWRGLKAFRAWLLTVIDHRIADYGDRLLAQRRSGITRTVSLNGLDADGSSYDREQQLPAGSTTPSRVAMRAELAAAMRSAVDAVPAECREVVWFRLFEQLPLEEIATRLGLGVSAVRHRFRRGAEIYARQLRLAMGSAADVTSEKTSTVCPEESAPFSCLPKRTKNP